MNASAVLPPHVAASLVLVRHGESAWIAEGRFQGRLDPPLSDLGRRQAQLVGRRLAQRDSGSALPVPAGPPTGIWHSPLSRAADTARAIATSQPGVAVHADEDLIEIAQGEWEGRLHSEVSAGWPAELTRWRRTPTIAHAPGGEPLLKAAKRVQTALDRIVASLGVVLPAEDSSDGRRAPGSDRVPGYPAHPPAGSRSEPWAIIVAHDGIFRLALMTMLSVPYERFWSFPFNLCAISVISLREGVAVLRAHNLSEHLAPLAAEQVAAEEARGDRRGAL